MFITIVVLIVMLASFSTALAFNPRHDPPATDDAELHGRKAGGDQQVIQQLLK